MGAGGGLGVGGCVLEGSGSLLFDPGVVIVEEVKDRSDGVRLDLEEQDDRGRDRRFRF